jgi:hypothetical protein
MFGSDRSWDSDWRGIASGRERGEGFGDDSREGADLIGELKKPVFEKSMAFKIHHGEAREGSHGRAAAPAVRSSNTLIKKRDVDNSGKEAGQAHGNEDVDAVWHRRSPSRSF